MMPVFEWMQATQLAQTIRHSASLIALLEIIHLIGLTLLLGTILMVDLSMLGLGIPRQPAALVARELNLFTVTGLTIMLVSGPLILCSEAVRCYKTPAFWVKMALLAIALVFHFTIHRRGTQAEHLQSRIIGVLSMALWFGVALAGKGIAIFQPA